MKNEPQDASSSLYHDQLVILGLEANSGELTARQTTERERIRTIDLPPLNFPVRSSLQWRDWIKNPMFFLKFWAPVVVLSVALVVGLPFLSPKDRLQFKGGQKVDLFWEREGQIHPLKEGASLLVGDRVSATIISTEKSLAYWFVTDDQFKILTPLSEVRESRLELEPGVLGQFQSSVTLVDPNEGEYFVIAVCPLLQAGATVEWSQSLSNLDPSALQALLQEGSISGSKCYFMGRQLRQRGNAR